MLGSALERFPCRFVQLNPSSKRLKQPVSVCVLETFDAPFVGTAQRPMGVQCRACFLTDRSAQPTSASFNSIWDNALP